MKKIWIMVLIVSLSLIIVAGCGSSQSKQTAKYPDKAVELIVPYAAGGGSDIIGRTIAEIAGRDKLVAQPIMVINKAGGSGAVGNSYVFSKTGDKYTLMTMNSGQALSALVNNAKVKAGDFTPIANLAMDEVVIAVRADSKFKTFADLVNAAKASPDSIVIGGAGMGSEDHLCWGLISKETNTKFKWVVCNSSGEVLSAVLGGHIDVGIFNPNEVAAQIQAGKMKAVGSFSKQRLTGIFKDVPTFAELGYPGIAFRQFRSVVGPPNMPKEAVEFWSGIFKQMIESEEWKKNYCERFMLTPAYMDANTYAKYHKEEEARLFQQIKAVGIAK